MQVITAEPPIMDKIDAVFHTRGKLVIYSWGDSVFIPHAMNFSPALQAHEAVHGERQMAFVDDDGERGIMAWWMRYLRDPAFRLAEEIPAHRAEYQYWARQPNANEAVTGFRSRRVRHLGWIAQRLAGPLYGGLISVADAKRAIEA